MISLKVVAEPVESILIVTSASKNLREIGTAVGKESALPSFHELIFSNVTSKVVRKPKEPTNLLNMRHRHFRNQLRSKFPRTHQIALCNFDTTKPEAQPPKSDWHIQHHTPHANEPTCIRQLLALHPQIQKETALRVWEIKKCACELPTEHIRRVCIGDRQGQPINNVLELKQEDLRETIIATDRQWNVAQRVVGPACCCEHGCCYIHPALLGVALVSPATPTIAVAALSPSLTSAITPGRGQCLSEILTVNTSFSSADWLKLRLLTCMSNKVVSPATNGMPEKIEEIAGSVLDRSAIASSARRIACRSSPMSTASTCTVRVILPVNWLAFLSPTGGSS